MKTKDDVIYNHCKTDLWATQIEEYLFYFGENEIKQYLPWGNR